MPLHDEDFQTRIMRDQSIRITMQNAEIAALKEQIPECMGSNKMLFIECAVGHGRIVGENWVKNECPYCQITSLQKQIGELKFSISCLEDTIMTYENNKAEARIKELTEALEGLIDDEPCSLDHHGYCQTHRLNNPCEMKIAKQVLEGKGENK